MIFHDISCKKKGPQHRLKSLDRLIWLVDCGNEALWSNMSKVYRSRSRTSIRIIISPFWCTHLLKCSSMIYFIGGNMGSLQFSGYWKRSMAIKIGYPPIIETTPVFTDMFLSNYNIIYLCKRFPANDSNNAYTSYSILICVYRYIPAKILLKHSKYQ